MRSILIESPRGGQFVRFANADGKAWIMPLRNMHVAMQLYQPSSLKGRLLRRLFPALCRMPMACSLLRAERRRCELEPQIGQLLCSLFDVEVLEFAIFEGTPSKHQKTTMQISQGDKILGYAKFTDSSEIYGMMQHEAQVLRHLQASGIGHVPKILHCGKAASLFALVQTTEKTLSTATAHEWGPMHEKFIADLRGRTAGECAFEDTGIYSNASLLQSNIEWLGSPSQKAIVERAIGRLMDRCCGKTFPCHAVHGDFTPWNTFVVRGSLFVFDWEYAYLNCPFDIDRYHFYTQTSIFERHLDAQAIIAESPEWIDPEAYAVYLLDTIARFMIRDNGNVQGDVKRLIDTWIQLLQHYSL